MTQHQKPKHNKVKKLERPAKSYAKFMKCVNVTSQPGRVQDLRRVVRRYYEGAKKKQESDPAIQIEEKWFYLGPELEVLLLERMEEYPGFLSSLMLEMYELLYDLTPDDDIVDRRNSLDDDDGEVRRKRPDVLWRDFLWTFAETYDEEDERDFRRRTSKVDRKTDRRKVSGSV